MKTNYYQLAIKDVNKKREPLYGVLMAAEETEAASSYLRGWKDTTGEDLLRYRVGDRR